MLLHNFQSMILSRTSQMMMFLHNFQLWCCCTFFNSHWYSKFSIAIDIAQFQKPMILHIFNCNFVAHFSDANVITHFSTGMLLNIHILPMLFTIFNQWCCRAPIKWWCFCTIFNCDVVAHFSILHNFNPS